MSEAVCGTVLYALFYLKTLALTCIYIISFFIFFLLCVCVLGEVKEEESEEGKKEGKKEGGE